MQFGILFLLMIFASFAEVVSIGAIFPFLGVLTAPERVFEYPLAQPLIRALNYTEPKQLLLPLTMIFSIAAIFSGVMRLILLWAQTRLSFAIGADLSISIYWRTLYQPYAVHVARNSSEVIAGISSKANRVVSSTVMPILSIFSSSMMLLAIMVMLVSIEPVVSFAAFVGFGVIYSLVILVTKKRLEQNSKQISRGQNQVIKALQEGLGGIRDVLIDGTQLTYWNIYRRADLMLRRAQANIKIIGNSPRFGIEALGMVLISVLAFSLVERSGGIVGAIPMLGALALGAQRLLPMLQQIYSSWSSIRGDQASLSDALDLLDQPLPSYVDAPKPAPILFQHSIKLNRLSFCYASQMPKVLHELNLTIYKNSCIGFIGSTGSGKSTLLDIIMGLLHPTEGSLAIDDQFITSHNHRAWQAHIAHVPQAIFLADTTIAENIAFGVPSEQIDYDRVRQAAQKAQIAQTIESWGQQYDTSVGERGIRLSGGQRQRIGIARALYKQADVIVFDEATSALDNDTERAVMEAIENMSGELTIIIVAHRLTTLKNCTQVIELKDGKIMRSGTYQEIISVDA
ncbi:MAG: ABC transporter ATP-binding protein/permease [Desulfobulbaceae bacterium]|nr:ABC transporter ATP-binding protein/permease [Desulfobulbaceae bacterium]